MNSITKTLFCFVTITYINFAQDTADSLSTNTQSIQLTKPFSTLLDDIDFYLDLQKLNKTLLFNTDPSTQWLWTTYAISNSGQETFQQNVNFDNMTLPLYQKHIENSKFNPFRYALGMIQTGAVGYLAYKHLKKYGFLKK